VPLNHHKPPSVLLRWYVSHICCLSYTYWERLYPAGQLHLQAKEYSEAGEVFEQLVEAREVRDDAYGRLGLANLVLASVPADSNKVCPPSTNEECATFQKLFFSPFKASVLSRTAHPGQGNNCRKVAGVALQENTSACSGPSSTWPDSPA